MSYSQGDFETFERLIGRNKCLDQGKNLLVPMVRVFMSDTLTPVLAYRRMIAPDDRMAPSFLLESVVGGDRVGRYSYLGCRPAAQLLARDRQVQYIDAQHAAKSRNFLCENPLYELGKMTAGWALVSVEGLPPFSGGWVGYVGYDAVRYVEGEKLSNPPPDDRGLPDLHMGLYRQVVAFDHVQKTVLVITHVVLDEHESDRAAYEAGQRELDDLVNRLVSVRSECSSDAPDGRAGELPVGQLDLNDSPPQLSNSNMGPGGYQRAVELAKQYIAAGDVFQVVPSQRFELHTASDPFDIYRALRVVNPSPYMFYLQIDGGMLVGSSPEILCRVHDRVVTARPLAGTRRRGRDQAEDQMLEAQLLADPKERAEHVMLVDLGRNDVGKVVKSASIQLPQLMDVERYSHVMHISSTVTGQLAEGLTCWDALRSTLPVGTVSGAPKVRAMQIIDELEPVRRGPYAGGVGYADFAGNMDMAIALRTMVITPAGSNTGTPDGGRQVQQSDQTDGQATWTVHIQAGGGIVADSDPESEYQETINKAAALAKAVHLAQQAFPRS